MISSIVPKTFRIARLSVHDYTAIVCAPGFLPYIRLSL